MHNCTIVRASAGVGTGPARTDCQEGAPWRLGASRQSGNQILRALMTWAAAGMNSRSRSWATNVKPR